MFAEVLHADGPAVDRALPMMLYGQFVGSWEGKLVYQEPDAGFDTPEPWHFDGAIRKTSCEVHFGWVLGGRAVQDVWIAPARRDRRSGEPDVMFGTTLRVFNPNDGVWRITWIDPVTQAFNHMTGREVDGDIVQEYRTDKGTFYQWMFTEITPRSFHWLWRESMDTGDPWKIRAECFLSRRAEEFRERGAPEHAHP